MTQSVTLELPFPPSANRYWRTTRGKVHVSSHARQYRKLVAQLGLVAAFSQHWNPQPDERYLLVAQLHYPTDRRSQRRDLDNCVKVLVDSLEYAGLISDDNQIHAIAVVRAIRTVGDGQCTVVLRKLSESPPETLVGDTLVTLCQKEYARDGDSDGSHTTMDT